MSRLVIGASQVVTARGPARPRHGAEMRELEILANAAVAIADDGRIAAVGDESDLHAEFPGAQVDEVQGVLFPGFVDAHTHGVFGGARTADHERRALGVDYKAIAGEGGGILSSVRDVRQRSAEELRVLTHARLQSLLGNGTTTVEIKSGYGLSLDAELKQLGVVGDLLKQNSGVGESDGSRQPPGSGDLDTRGLRHGGTEALAAPVGRGPHLVPTFLGAHEVPEEYRSDRRAYLDLVVRKMLPEVARLGLARFCDVFCEPGVYTPEESRIVLEAAREAGLGLKLHADELDGSGGAELAAELGAVSADHLAAISDAGIAALAKSETVAVLLPGTQLFLGRSSRAPARRLVDEGAAVALATDFNPGSSPGMSLPLMAMLGVSQLGLRASEAVTAITVNGAAAIGEAQHCGQLVPGFRGDMVLAAITDWRELPYWYGSNVVSRVWVNGVPCHPLVRLINS